MAVRFPELEWFRDLTYSKMCVEVNGDFELTTAPPELLLGTARYHWIPVDRRCAIAYDPSSRQPRNEYWHRVRRSHWPHVNGPVVLFRHDAAFEYRELGLTKLLGPRRFFLLRNETNAKWQRPWLQ